MAILIVDDNPRMREMIRAVLAPVDEHIHECPDGAEAVELYRQIRPSWVLMDVAMERMDGLAATRAIRDVDPLARVVVVTEHMEPELRRAAAEAGASAYVLKEDLSALLRVLDPQRKPHSALRASELRYRSLFDGVPVGLYRTTPDGRVIDANAALVELLGFEDRESLLNTAAADLYSEPFDRQLWMQLLERDGVVRDFEVRVRRRDGTVVWVRHSARVVYDDRGKVLCYEGAVQDVTERRRAEDALRLSETRYRVLYDENPSMYFTVDPAGTVLSVNAFGAGQLGYVPAELLGRPVTRVVHPDDRATAVAQVTTCAAHPGRLYEWEFRKVRKDGSMLWVKETARAAHSPEGLVVFIVCEDVTERKQAEEELQGERRLFLQGPAVVFRWRAEPGGPVEYVSPNAAEVFGRPAADFLEGRVLYESVIHPEDLERVTGELASYCAENVNRFEQHYRIVRPDRAVRWLDDYTQLSRDANGRVTHYEGYVLDVTRRHEADSARRASEERYHALYDDTPSMYFTVDPAGRVLSVNQYGAAELGYTVEQLIGESVLCVFHEPDRATALEHVARCVAEPGRVFHWELRKVRKDGSILWVKETARAVRGADGALVMLVVCEDVTERKRTEEQLRRAETMAATGSLVLGVAHEVRNPLHAITGAVECLSARGVTAAEALECAEVMHAQVGRLQRLMQELLAFGRPAPVELAPGALEGVLAEALAGYRVAADRRAVRLAREVAAPLPAVPMDRGRLVQLFTNLVENALAHAPPGSDIRVSARPTADGAWVECTVTDGGPGFSPADLEHVFEPFYTRRPGGTGLGLSIVQRIVDQHRGHVEAANAPGGGAAVLVRLPTAEAAAERRG